jgi:hypothetical protein
MLEAGKPGIAQQLFRAEPDCLSREQELQQQHIFDAA